MLVSSIGCSDMNSVQLIQEQALAFGTIAVIGVVYVAYKKYKKREHNRGNYYTAYPTIPNCPVGYYQGCCSYHQGIAGCHNYRVVCNDGQYSPSCQCGSNYCAFQ